MFDNFNAVKLEELKRENELFYNLAVNILKTKNALVTPLTVKQLMVEFDSLEQDENLKEIIECLNREEKAYVMLQTGDISKEDYDRLVDIGLLTGNFVANMKKTETKSFPKKVDLSIKSPRLVVEDKCMEERLAVCVKNGIYSLAEVQKMINNGLVDVDLLDKYYEMYGLNRKRNSNLAQAFKPIMTFDGVRINNDVVIGGTTSADGISNDPKTVDELANRKIYIF